MGNGNSIINIGELAKPATVLIEKISDAIGGYLKPWQIKRVAQAEAEAEAEAERIKAIAQIETQIELADISRRALGRFLIEETNKQNNMESIISKAIPQLTDNSKPDKIDNDWITNFFDKCRLVSDEEMQELWAKVLAGEANSPGRYSKRTVKFLGSLDKSDATLFTTFCGFVWFLVGAIPLIYDFESSIYTEHGINFNVLEHLNDIGLLRLEALSGYKWMQIPKSIQVFYYSTPINIDFVQEENNVIEIGKVLFSKIGQELGSICGSKPIPGFLDYVIKYWIKKGLILSSPYPRAPE